MEGIIIQLNREELSDIIMSAVRNAITQYDRERKINEINIKEKNKIISLEEARKFLGISKSKIYLLTSQNEIPFIKQRNKIYFKTDELEEWLYSFRQKTKQETEEEAEKAFLHRIQHSGRKKNMSK